MRYSGEVVGTVCQVVPGNMSGPILVVMHCADTPLEMKLDNRMSAELKRIFIIGTITGVWGVISNFPKSTVSYTNY